MTPELQALIDARLSAFRQFTAACAPELRGARLVQYRGADFVGVIDVVAHDIEGRLAGALSEGLSVDWLSRNGVVYLRAFGPDGPAPSWERVFAEEDLADMKAILREEDFGDEA